MQSIRPSVREQVAESLRSPHTVLGCACCKRSSSKQPTAPHISLLMQQYRDAGVYLNLFDWWTQYHSAFPKSVAHELKLYVRQFPKRYRVPLTSHDNRQPELALYGRSMSYNGWGSCNRRARRRTT